MSLTGDGDALAQIVRQREDDSDPQRSARELIFNLLVWAHRAELPLAAGNRQVRTPPSMARG